MRRLMKTKFLIICVVVIIVGCGGSEPVVIEEPTVKPTAVPEPTATLELNLPEITAVTPDQSELPNYGTLEMLIELDADYKTPYDAREITLDGVFIAPDGTEMNTPGFWDGEESWRIRFTPSQVGEWQYQLTVTDVNGTSDPVSGMFSSMASDQHGWLQPGNAVDPDYSGHYLVYHDGTPFYGLGHADALNILIDGFNIDRGVGLFDNMVEAGENYVVWWPL